MEIVIVNKVFFTLLHRKETGELCGDVVNTNLALLPHRDLVSCQHTINLFELGQQFTVANQINQGIIHLPCFSLPPDGSQLPQETASSQHPSSFFFQTVFQIFYINSQVRHSNLKILLFYFCGPNVSGAAV